MRIQGKKLSEDKISQVVRDLSNLFGSNFFETEVNKVNSSSIKIGMHMKCFQIDPVKLGYNTRITPYRTSRTRTPTWDQRVTFNNILNEYLTEQGISCNIKSGDFTIRKGLTAFTENDWHAQVPDHAHENTMRGYSIEAYDYKLEAKKEKAQVSYLKLVARI